MSSENNNEYASCLYRAFREGSGKSDGYADFGSRYRYNGFQNSDRLNTGYICRDGSFQQTYPVRQKFYSLQAWKNAVTRENPTAFFLGEEEWHYQNVLSSGQWSPIYKQKLETKMREYARRMAQRPTTEPTAAEAEPRATVEKFTCPACGLGSGADHRMCICRSYNYSVEAWEIACGLRVPEKPVAAPVAAVEPATTTIPGEENFGSSTYRAYKNGQRVATAVVLGIHDGSICQVWPLPKRNFYSLSAWKKAMREEHGETDIKGEEETIYRHYYAQHEDVIGNTYEVALRQTLEDYGRIIQQRPDEEPPVAAKAEEPIPLASIPTPPPHTPAPNYQVGYLATAVFGNDSDGMTVQQKTCSNLIAAGEILRNYYRAYCLMMDEPDEHFLDKKLTAEHLHKCLSDPAECNVAFFDSLSLSIREMRIWC